MVTSVGFGTNTSNDHRCRLCIPFLVRSYFAIYRVVEAQYSHDALEEQIAPLFSWLLVHLSHTSGEAMALKL